MFSFLSTLKHNHPPWGKLTIFLSRLITIPKMGALFFMGLLVSMLSVGIVSLVHATPCDETKSIATADSCPFECTCKAANGDILARAVYNCNNSRFNSVQSFNVDRCRDQFDADCTGNYQSSIVANGADHYYKNNSDPNNPTYFKCTAKDHNAPHSSNPQFYGNNEFEPGTFANVVLQQAAGTLPLGETMTYSVGDENQPLNFKVVSGDNNCPSGYTLLATVGDVTSHKTLACGVLGRWDIARLADGGSIYGPGYNCRIQANDTRSLGHSLCKLQEGTTSDVISDETDFGYALEFDGNDYVPVNSNDKFELGNNFTIEAWIKINAFYGIQRIFSKRNLSQSGGYGFGINNSRLRFTTYGIKNYETKPLNLSTGVWYHVAVTLDNANDASFYLNGNFIQKVSGSEEAKGGKLIRIGSGPRNKQYWIGQLDEIRIWDVVRSKKDIRQNMYDTLQKNKNLIASYSFEDGVAEIAKKTPKWKSDHTPKQIINDNLTLHYCDYVDKYFDILNHAGDSLSLIYSDLKKWRQTANVIVQNTSVPEASVRLKMILAKVMKEATKDLHKWKLDMEDKLYDCFDYRALVIGISEYDSLSDLDKSAEEAQDIATILQYDYGFAEVTLLTDEMATKDNIENAYKDLLENAIERDFVLIYYAGHGENNEQEHASWLSVGGDKVEIKELNDTMSKSQARKILVVADSCYFTEGNEQACSAKVEETEDDSYPTNNKVRTALFSTSLIPDYKDVIIRDLRNRSHVIISSGNNEPVGDGVFGQAFINTLRSQLTSSEQKKFKHYKMFTAQKVFENIKIAMNNAAQNPKYVVRNNGDFIFRTMKPASMVTDK